MDFLGLTTLTVLHDTVQMIQQNRGAKIDIDNLALDDAETYKLFARGEPPPSFNLNRTACAISFAATSRPVSRISPPSTRSIARPIQGGMIDDFINRKQGKTRVSYELPQLKEILEETYGVILYQEQVMQIANLLASFSLGEADILRRAMVKRRRRNGRATRQVHGWVRRQQNPREKGRAHLQPDGRVCRLWVQQIAFLRLRVACLSDCLLENALSR